VAECHGSTLDYVKTVACRCFVSCIDFIASILINVIEFYC